MKTKAVAAARQALEYAREEASKCVTGEGHAALAKHWAMFLVFSNQFFNKLKAGVKADPVAAAWFEGVERTRRDDELLSYIQHARNAAEHGLADPTAFVRSRLVGFSILPNMARPLTLPEATAMMPVWSRGTRGNPPKRHNPPRTHLGRPIDIPTPNPNHPPTFMALAAGTMERPEPFRRIADLAVAYMEKTLDEAAGHVRPESGRDAESRSHGP